MNFPRIAVTMGDPAGIGPEICLRLLNDDGIAGECVPIIFGDAGVLRRVAQKLGLAFKTPVIPKADWAAGDHDSCGPSVLDLGLIDGDAVRPGRVDARCGEAAFQYVIAAIE